jgi:glycerol uptake operon antiterminator
VVSNGQDPVSGSILAQELTEWATVPSVIFPLNYSEFLQSPRALCTLAAVPLDACERVFSDLSQHGRIALLNIDTCPGFGRDDAVLTFLKRIGVAGVMSTRLALLQKARSLGLFTVQVLFLTDGSTVGKGAASIRSANPHLVQVMPFPVIAHLTAPERRNLGRFVASGFVRTRSDVTDAIASGAMGVTTTTVDLWTLRRSEVGEQA